MRGIQIILGLLITASAFGAIQHGNQTIKGTLNVTGLTTLGTASSTQFNADNLRLDGNTLSTTNTNGDLTIDLNGTGSTIFADLTATTVPYLDASKKLTSSAATPTQLTYLANATANLCGISQSCTLTNHTLTGNTAANLISGSGTFILNTTGTMTVPNGTDTLGAVALAQTFTNKTLTAPAINAANLNFGTASNTNRLLLPKDTTTNLDALTDTQSALAFDTTTGKPVYNNGTGWVEVGSGSGSGGGSGINILAGFNNNADVATTANWSETGGGTLAVTSTSADVANGTYAFSFDASAASDYAISDARNIPSGLFGANCLAEFYYKGFDANITAQVHDGTNVLASQVLSAATNYSKVQINFPCPSSGTLALKFLASANSAIGYFDEVHLGSATNLSSDSVITPFTAYTPTFTGFGTASGVSFYSRRIGDTLEVHGTFTCGTSTATQARITLGYDGQNANVTAADTAKITSGGQVTGSGFFSVANAVSIVIIPIPSQNYFAIGVQTATTAGYAGVNGNAICSSGQTLSIYAYIPIAGWTTTSVAALKNAEYWRVDANIGGSNFDLGTSDQASYIGMVDASMTLTNNTGDGVLTAQIPCSSTNAPTGTTCAVGSESNGVSFTIPRAGAARACVSFGHNMTLSGGGDVNATFQIVETASNAQTILQEGKSRVQSRSLANGTWHLPHQLCGTFNFSSAGQKTLRLFYEQDNTATVASNLVLADGTLALGQRDIHWEVYPIDNKMPAPVLVGSVTSNSSGAERVERARVAHSSAATTVCSASPCTIWSQSGTWLTGCTRASAGNYTCTIATGIFSSTPACTVMASGAATYTSGLAAAAFTSTSLNIGTGSGSTPTDTYFDIICMGPR